MAFQAIHEQHDIDSPNPTWLVAVGMYMLEAKSTFLGFGMQKD